MVIVKYKVGIERYQLTIVTIAIFHTMQVLYGEKGITVTINKVRIRRYKVTSSCLKSCVYETLQLENIML